MEFLDKLNEMTNGKFSYLKVSEVEIQKKPPIVKINFLLPYDILDSMQEEDKNIIYENVVKLLPESMQVEVTYTKSFINEDVVKKYVLSYFKEKHPTVLVEDSEIEIKLT